MIRPDPSDDEIHGALEIILAEQRASASSVSIAGNSETSAVGEVVDTRRLENALRQLARYREELKQAPDAPAAESKPRQIGRFEIVRELGRGGCGIVFLARDPELRRLVALKVPHPAALVSPELQRRFVIEARAAAGLEHPGIIRVYEVGTTGPISWIASEYCAGITLQLYLERCQTNVAPRAAAQLIRRLALAIDYAHERGILHRDLKPANVLLEGDFGEADTALARDLPPLAECQPKLTDFGLAKILNEAQDATQTQFPMGTPAYMSPEQIAGLSHQISNTSDVYSLGIILYELLAGVPPFRGSSRTETWRQILHGDPKPIRIYRADVPRDLQAIVRRATEKKPSERYPSARELAADLQRFLAGEPTHARPLGLVTRAVRWTRRHPAATGMIGIVAVSLLLLFAGGYWHLHTIEEELRINRELRATGETQLDELRHVAYLRSMQLVDSSLGEAKLEAALASLQEHVPKNGEPDRRDFVWHHLWNRCHHEAWRIKQGETVSALAFSPDGKILASGEHNVLIYITDTATGAVLRKLVGHSGNINALAFHGGQLVSAADDGKIMLWNPQTGNRLGELVCHKRDILCLAIHPNKPWVVTAGVEAEIRLWDLSSKTLVKEFIGEDEWVRGVGFSPDGRSLISTGHEQRVRCWDIETGKLQWITERVDGKLHALAVHTDANTVYVGGHSGKVHEYRISDGQFVDSFNTDMAWIRGLAYSAKARLLGVCANCGRIRVWKVNQPTSDPPLFDFAAHHEGIWSIAFDPNGSVFATGGSDRLLKLWHNDTDRQSGYRVWTFHNVSSKRDIRVDFEMGKVLYVGNGNILDVNLRDFGTDKFYRHDFFETTEAAIDPRGERVAMIKPNKPLIVATRFGYPDQTQRFLGIEINEEDKLAWLPNGDTLAVFSKGKNLRFWDVDKDVSRGECATPPQLKPLRLSLSPNGHYAALQYSDPRTLHALNLQTKKIVWQTPSTREIPVFSKDNKLLATGSSENTLKVFDLEQCREIGHYAGKAKALSALAITPDNRLLAAAYVDSTIQFWDIRSGAKVLEVPTAYGTPTTIFFSPDSRQMLVTVHHRNKYIFCDYSDFRNRDQH